MGKNKGISFNPIWILLFLIPLLFSVLFIYRFAPQVQFAIFALAAALYVALAALHHHKDRTLTLEIMIEYLLIAALALIILQGLLVRI